MAGILIGTCAWADHERFYPEGLKPAERLPFYARFFPLVEVDSTYYHLQPRRNFELWAQRTPPGFTFNVKAHKSMTRHERDPATATPLPLEEVFASFAAAVEPLRQVGKLRALHFQFPPWFVRRPDNLAYLQYCRERLPDHTIAVEFRHVSWLSPERRRETLDFLAANRFVHVICDAPQVGTGTVPAVVAATNPDLTIVRFHGRNRDTWYAKAERTGERFNYLYREDELRDWVPHVRNLAARVGEVHLLMNNNRENYAVRNAHDLARLLDLGYPDPFAAAPGMPAAPAPPAGADPAAASPP